MQEKYYLIILQCGHVGHRKSLEIKRYFKDFDILNAYISAKKCQGLRKKIVV